MVVLTGGAVPVTGGKVGAGAWAGVPVIGELLVEVVRLESVCDGVLMFPMESEVEGDDSPLPEDCDNSGADMLQSDKERCQNNTPRGGLQMTDDKSTSIKNTYISTLPGPVSRSSRYVVVRINLCFIDLIDSLHP